MRPTANDEILAAVAQEIEQLPAPSEDVFARTMAVYRAEVRSRMAEAHETERPGILARATTALVLGLLPPAAAETLATGLGLSQRPAGADLVPRSMRRVAHLFGLV